MIFLSNYIRIVISFIVYIKKAFMLIYPSDNTTFCNTFLQSKMIGDAAYKSVWYDFAPKESKLVLLIILRSQRRLTITAGNMMDLSLEGFTSVRF